MTRKAHIRAADLHGVSRLAIDATLGLTRLVETMHHNIARVPGPLGKFSQEPTRGITGFVYRTIQGTTRLIGSGLDALLGQLAPLLDSQQKSSSGPREAVLAALNGVLGDHLAASGNPLAIPIHLRRHGQVLSLTAQDLAAQIPRPGGRILILIHGLCMNDLQWRRKGHDHGEALAKAAGFTPLYLHYNSGLHVSTNGHALAGLLERLLDAWPVPVEELVILAHSMGGLLARSAVHYGERAGQAWPQQLRKLAFLGTPHEGAPLERGGNWVNVVLEVSPYTAALARLAKIRSAGITDLRHGSILDEDWRHGDRFARARGRPSATPLPQGVQCFAVGATIGRADDGPDDSLLGDGLVPLRSALGQHRDKRLALDFPESHQWIGRGLNHLDLLDNAGVYAQLRRWLD
jgi:hypothetical protein